MRGEILSATIFSILGATAFAGALAAQTVASVACSAPVIPTGELGPWNTPATLSAAASEGSASRSRLFIGQAVRLTLLSTPEVRYPLRPEKPGGSGSYGGLVRIDVSEPGTYRVVLGSAAWIDLVGGGKAVISTAHGHGPDCSGIRKIVDFPLTAGRYTLQIAANSEPQTTVLIVRLP